MSRSGGIRISAAVTEWSLRRLAGRLLGLIELPLMSVPAPAAQTP